MRETQQNNILVAHPATPALGVFIKLVLLVLLLFFFIADAIMLAGLTASRGREGCLSVGRRED